MNRNDFESIRDLPNKTIVGNIKLVAKRNFSPNLVAEDILVNNSLGIDARMTIQYNPEVGSKTINIHIPGIGPICRLDVDGPPHRPFGRSHKHSLSMETCPNQNLAKGVIDRPDLANKTLAQVFEEFCNMANITYNGSIELPAEGGGT